MGKLKDLIKWECEKCSRVARDFFKVGLEGEEFEELCDYVKRNAKPVCAEYYYIGNIDKGEWSDEYLTIFTYGIYSGYGFSIYLHKDGRVEYILDASYGDSEEYEVINASTEEEFLDRLDKVKEKELVNLYFANCKKGVETLYNSPYVPFVREEE